MVPGPVRSIGQSRPYLVHMITIYVPRPGSELEEEVWPRSGMVGSPEGSTGRLRVDYEGDEELYPRFVERIRRAADRHRWSGENREGYPTRAVAHVDESEIVAVGRYDPQKCRVLVDDGEAFKAWLGVDELAGRELRADAE